MCLSRISVVLLLVAVPTATAHASPELLVDGGLVLAQPAALPTGLSTGVGAGLTRSHGWLAYGTRLGWSSATEHALGWDVRHDDLRLRAVVGVQHSAGRGTFALRLGAGGTLVHETRTRQQGERAGLTGDDLETSASRLLPAGDLELSIQLQVTSRLRFVLGGGPTVGLLDGDVRPGFVGGLGFAWQL